MKPAERLAEFYRRLAAAPPLLSADAALQQLGLILVAGVDVAEHGIQVARIDQRPDLAVVDRGYRGHGALKTRVLISGTRRGLTPKLIADLRRRSAIEAEIGHMKTDGRLSRSPLKGTLGDALFAVLCGCGHNIRKILAYLRALLATITAAILSALRATEAALRPATTA